MVSESSGCLDTAEKIGLQRTHFDINKFGKPTDEEYQTVCDSVIEMVEAAPGMVESRAQREYSPLTKEAGKLPS